MSDRYPLPDVDWEPAAGFWAAAARDELAIPRCSACGTFNWYPRDHCSSCGSSDMPWSALRGRGTLFSWSVVARPLYRAYAEMTPYVTGLVALEEDPAVRLVTTVVDCQPDALRIDMPVRVVFGELSFPGVEGSVRAPFFTPEVS